MEKINWKKHLKVSATVVALVAGATVVWASGGGNGEAVHHNAWKDVDTWKVLNFVLLALGCFFIAKKPVAQFFSSRTKGIEEELTDLEQKKAEAERKLAEYQARFRNLEQESEQIIEDYIKQGEDAKKRIIAEAEAQAEKLEDMAKRNIEQEFKAAKALLKQEIVDRAMEQAEALIKKSITTQDQNRLVDEYLKKVEA
ncbi:MULTISPECIES: F0F1 ATP synthase subunit B [unclassified Desulfobacter]|uniref:F0F1 ATP synthase subunit B n=1 Tax=unclassified Desulfobacter TaxID=2634406 RepID=UPI000E9E9410|nr:MULTISPECIES: F0F1 ATP synthase subunit B [unclassified Desulfobacter]MBP8829709.1 F0F1 ATP synthase subunit B [Desulfobacter sp.]MDQ1269457.1 F-type H+-transporting ATPase subunit b [Thermodesulfobacteriota bacterium]HBT87060.1 ATP synthase F0 subunit B [Desulfobacter sp.]